MNDELDETNEGPYFESVKILILLRSCAPTCYVGLISMYMFSESKEISNNPPEKLLMASVVIALEYIMMIMTMMICII